MSGTKLADSVDQILWNPSRSPGSYLAYNNWLPYGNTGIPMCTTGPTAAKSYLMSDNLASSAKFAQNNAGMAATPYSWRHMYDTIFNNSGTCGQKGINCNVNANAKGPNPFVNAKNNELGCLSYPNSCTDGTGSGLDPTPGDGSGTGDGTICTLNWPNNCVGGTVQTVNKCTTKDGRKLGSGFVCVKSNGGTGGGSGSDPTPGDGSGTGDGTICTLNWPNCVGGTVQTVNNCTTKDGRKLGSGYVCV
tara:strand:+ start:67 stop:807 length:741 start_codon:yes stop_codon:yes gene_type:complete